MPKKLPTHKPMTSGKRADDRPTAARRGYGGRWQRLRMIVLRRDCGICSECGLAVGASGHVDHIIPRNLGGSDKLSNLQTLCASCHSKKTATNDNGFGNRGRGVGISTASNP